MSGDEMSCKEGGVVFLCYAFEDDTLKRFVGFEHARFGRKSLYMLHMVMLCQRCEPKTIDLQRLTFRREEGLVVDNLDVTAKAHDFVAYLVFEAENDAQRKNHHRKTNGNTPHGNGDGGA